MLVAIRQIKICCAISSFGADRNLKWHCKHRSPPSRWEVCGAVVGRRQRDSRHSVQFPLHCNYSAGMSLTMKSRAVGCLTFRLSHLKWRLHSKISRVRWRLRVSTTCQATPLNFRFTPRKICVGHEKRPPALFRGNFKQKCRKESGFNSLPLSDIAGWEGGRFRLARKITRGEIL